MPVVLLSGLLQIDLSRAFEKPIMSPNCQSFSNVSCIREVAHLKRWQSDGAIYLDLQSVEHVVQPPDNIELCALTEHTLVLVRSAGDRRVSQFAGQKYEGAHEANYFFLLPAGTPAELAWASQSEALLFSIAPKVLCQIAEQTECADRNSLQLKPLVHHQDDQITRFAQCLLDEIRTEGPGRRLCSESLMTILNIHLLRHYCYFKGQPEIYRGGLAPYKLQQVLGYINANLVDGDLSLATLSRLAGLSNCYFARQFKQATGQAPRQYIIHQRIDKAKTLLSQRDLSIAQIAIECGFSSQSHFYGAFQKVMGTTPKRYRDNR